MSNVAVATLAAILALAAWASTRDSDQPEASTTPADSNQQGASTSTTTADSNQGAANQQEADPIRITKVSYDPPGPHPGSAAHSDGEWVTIKSFGQQTRHLRDWTLRDSAGHVFRFPRFHLRPDTTVTVHSGDGQRTRHDLYWGKDKDVWRNSGGHVTLRNSDGRRIDRCGWDNGDGLKHC